MQDKISISQISEIISASLQQNFWSREDTAIIFQNLSFLKNRISSLITSFPEHTLHAIAAKANPLPAILKYLHNLNVGLEAATLSEVYLAEMSGYAADKIVYDSPAKTHEELLYALQKGIYLNIDSFNELDRVADLMKKLHSSSIIGLRINPQVGAGTISTTSVAGEYSKFGIPLAEFEDELFTCYKKYPWLTAVHVHIGSQGCTLDQLLNAANAVYSFAEKVNQHRGNNRENQIHYFDIGGGLPVKYANTDNPPTLNEYIYGLKKQCPRLFKDYKLVTEFGRYVHANSGWTASRVEYVKSYSGKKTVVIHVGADQLMRRCYQPDYWHHDISVLDSKGQEKSAFDLEPVTIAGPLCFSGDIIAHDIKLPTIEEGDFIIIHDTGGYTLSMWSRHTSRQIPKVLGYKESPVSFEILKQRESLNSVFKFWE